MGVPADIRAMKPGTGYEVKEKGGRYYVYEVFAKKLASGAWARGAGVASGESSPARGSCPTPIGRVCDVLLMARRLKLVRGGGSWVLANSRKRDLETLRRLGFEPVRRLDAV